MAVPSAVVPHWQPGDALPPPGLLDWTSEIVLSVKGPDGIPEIIGRLLLLAVNPTLGVAFLTVFDGFMVWLTYREFGNHRRRQPAVA